MLRPLACAVFAAAAAGCAAERPRQLSATPPQLSETRPNASFYYEPGERDRVQAQAEKFCGIYGMQPELRFDGVSGGDLLAEFACR